MSPRKRKKMSIPYEKKASGTGRVDRRQPQTPPGEPSRGSKFEKYPPI